MFFFLSVAPTPPPPPPTPLPLPPPSPTPPLPLLLSSLGVQHLDEQVVAGHVAVQVFVVQVLLGLQADGSDLRQPQEQLAELVRLLRVVAHDVVQQRRVDLLLHALHQVEVLQVLHVCNGEAPRSDPVRNTSETYGTPPPPKKKMFVVTQMPRLYWVVNQIIAIQNSNYGATTRLICKFQSVKTLNVSYCTIFTSYIYILYVFYFDSR